MSAERIKELQQAYRGIHEKVLEVYESSDLSEIPNLQAREERVVQELRELGASPYPERALS